MCFLAARKWRTWDKLKVTHHLLFGCIRSLFWLFHSIKIKSCEHSNNLLLCSRSLAWRKEKVRNLLIISDAFRCNSKNDSVYVWRRYYEYVNPSINILYSFASHQTSAHGLGKLSMVVNIVMSLGFLQLCKYQENGSTFRFCYAFANWKYKSSFPSWTEATFRMP